MTAFRKSAIGVALLSTFSLAAQAAEPIRLASLADVNGKVLVNKGKGYVTAKPGTLLEPGDRIISLNGSRAAVVFPSGCVTELKENSLLSLDKSGSCDKKPVSTGAAEPLRYAQAIGGTASDAGNGGDGEGGGGGVGGGLGTNIPMTGLLIAGGVLLLGGAIINAERNANNDDTPISGQ